MYFVVTNNEKEITELVLSLIKFHNGISDTFVLYSPNVVIHFIC
jgi:hypothetical protein